MTVLWFSIRRRFGQTRRYREALVRIAGTPMKNSTDEAKDMAREAMSALHPRSANSQAISE